MDVNTIKSILEIGETIAVEFKRCGNNIENDVYESVCSFLNRFGGDLFMGVLDDGTVCGVPEKAAPDMVKNFISCISNPALFSPTVYLTPEILSLALLKSTCPLWYEISIIKLFIFIKFVNIGYLFQQRKKGLLIP